MDERIECASEEARGFDQITVRVFIIWLLENHLSFPHSPSLLEVGALKPDNYHTCSSWIEWTPIDLHSRHPHIVEQDFLLMDADQHASKWGAISLSLVLNFVPLPLDRGEHITAY
jgi:25S rRNA (adenine2142-N1)-methyltransferase